MFYKVFYTNWFIPKGSAGCAWSFLIFIRPDHSSDQGLLQHELTHVKQFYRQPLVHGIKYAFDPSYRLDCEVEAYREQMRYYPTDLSELFALYLSRDYGLDIDVVGARELLTL